MSKDAMQSPSLQPAGHSIVIAATFTAEPMQRPLAAWSAWLDRPAQTHFAPFNQVFQQLLDPASTLSRNTAGTNIVLLRVVDWSRSNLPDAANGSAQEFLQAVESFTTRNKCPLIICICPSLRQDSEKGLQEVDAAIETLLVENLHSIPSVIVVTHAVVTNLYPVEKIYDTHAARAGCIPFTQDYFNALATWITRRQQLLQRAPAKVVVLDCDQTLWDGVCGEDGPLGIRLSSGRLALQKRLLELRDAGFLLCLCSKNVEQDVWAVFEQNSSMLLQRAHFSAARINWKPKSENLRQLSAQLKLGLDSFVFIDDNPIECADVRANCPQVLAIHLPIGNDLPCDLQKFSEHVWAFDHGPTTAEDQHRADRYTQETQREAARVQAPSLSQFLDSLQLELQIATLTPVNAERATQLTQRTNQFNFTTKRRILAEMREVLNRSDMHGFLVAATDRFGDYGQVGLAITQLVGFTLELDTFLLSCRALGKRIELRMLDEVCSQAKRLGATSIKITFVPSSKNQPAQEFFDQLLADQPPMPAVVPVEMPVEMPVEITVEQLAGAIQRLRANTAIASIVDSPKQTLSLQRPAPSELYSQIASQLQDVDSISQKIRSEANRRPELDEPYVAPVNTIEHRVTEICQDVLNLDRVGVYDSLKGLGASSLHLVQIYSRLKNELAAGITITDLFALPTIAALVARIGSTQENKVDVEPRSSQAKLQMQLATCGIAVIGMAGRFPGAANVREFWRNLTQGTCSIVDIPDTELNLSSDSPLRSNPNLVRRAASVRDVEMFDAKFFGISPKEATIMDPQHRLLLEVSWHAIEDAGYNVEDIELPVGVFAGCHLDTYILSSLATSPRWIESLANAFHGGDLLTELGNDKDYLATRISFLLNLRGPSMTIQTACSTSLVAISQACQSLVSGQCDMALAGGSTLKLPHNRGYLYTDGGIVAPDGMCRAFDAQARGTVFGEGCGAVLLKRVEDALADGDDIYAVIRGWGINNDGRAKMGYTAPSVDGQTGAIEMAHRMAGIQADSVTLVEAHGTGTSLGDPIEIDSLTKAFRKTTDQKQYCAIGSLKTNIGHLDVAAGVAGLIKTSLALRHQLIPASLNFERPNPNIDFESSPFFVNTKLRTWDVPSPRRAGLSSFGVGGTNAHVVLEEAPVPLETTHACGPQLFPLSARSASALGQATLELVAHLKSNPDLKIADVAYTLQTGRKTFNYTKVVVAHDSTELISKLAANDPGQVYEHRQVRRGVPTVFMFPGQGSQHLNMAKELFETDEVFRAHFDQCAEILVPHLGFDIRHKIFQIPFGTTDSAADNTIDDGTHQLNQTAVAQTSIFSVAFALAKRLEAYGIRPSQMVGHSVGEFVAACLAGVFSLEDALRLVAFRAAAMQELPRGKMLAVRLSESELRLRLGSHVAVAAINSPNLCVVSGPNEPIDELQKELELQDVACRLLHTSHAFHSAMMDPVVEPFAAQIRQIKLNAPAIPIVSSVTGQILTGSQAQDPSYWARHLRETVRFTDALGTLCQDSEKVLLEVGPGQTLVTLAKQHPARIAGQAVYSTLPHAKQAAPSTDHFLLTLGRLWQSGVDVDWKHGVGGSRRLRLHLPGYPFERQRYWLPDNPPGETPLRETEADPSSAIPKDKTTEKLALDNPQVATSALAETTLANVDSDAVRRRVIEQQLQLMKQQLEVWRQ